MNLIKEIHNYLSKDIEKMNRLILDSLVVEEELITVVGNYLATSGGKRMRPMVTILSAKMFGYKGENAIRLAAAVEFIHMATLLHDDVVDGSKMRRFLPTANVIWGNKASILVGDFLFSQSFRMCVSTQSIPALNVLSATSSIIIEGEVSQLTQLEQKRLLSEEEYLKVIKAKTAELFGSACEVGAIISNRKDCAEDIREFGMNLGSIFQITDDALDYFGDSDEVGKNVGDDFFEGKVTLPLILLSQKISESDKINLQKMLKSEERSPEDFNWVKDLLQKHKVQDATISYLQDFIKNSYESLDKIEINNQSKQYLKDLVQFAITRTR